MKIKEAIKNAPKRQFLRRVVSVLYPQLS